MIRDRVSSPQPVAKRTRSDQNRTISSDFIAAGACDALLARGIAVYPEVGQRKVSLRVPDELAAKLKGSVRIRYSEDREIGGGTIDEAERVVK